MNASDRKNLSTTGTFSLKVWDEATVNAAVAAGISAGNSAGWVQGLFCLIHKDVVPNVKPGKEGQFVGNGTSYDKLVTARNEALAEACGMDAAELDPKAKWSKGTICKGIQVLTALKSYEDILAMSAQELSEWVNELSRKAVSTVHAEMFPAGDKPETDPFTKAVAMYGTLLAFCDKHGLEIDDVIAAYGQGADELGE